MRIQAGRWLVGNHEPGPLDQGARDSDPLTLPAGQGVRPMPGVLQQANRFELRRYPAAPLSRRHARDEQGVVHVFGHRHHRHQIEVLEHEAECVTPQQRALYFVQIVDHLAAQNNVTRVRRINQAAQVQDRALAAARRPGQRQ